MRRLWMLAALAGSLAHTIVAQTARSDVPMPASPMRERWSAALTFDQFIAVDSSRRASWANAYAGGGPTVDRFRARVARISGRWRLLVVAESWCSDALASVPFLARLADAESTITVRLLRRADAAELLANHRLGSRIATPVVLVLDDRFVEHGAWIERPAALNEVIVAKSATCTDAEIGDAVRAWRKSDAGSTAVDEVLTLIERAAKVAADGARR